MNKYEALEQAKIREEFEIAEKNYKFEKRNWWGRLHWFWKGTIIIVGIRLVGYIVFSIVG